MGMVLFVERRAAKVDESNVRVLENLFPSSVGSFRDKLPIKLRVDEEDVLGLEICVHEVEAVQKGDALE